MPDVKKLLEVLRSFDWKALWVFGMPTALLACVAGTVGWQALVVALSFTFCGASAGQMLERRRWLRELAREVRSLEDDQL